MLTYLAVPYSHADPAIRQQRFEQVNRVAAKLIMDGHIIFSPISHSHHMATEHGLSGDWEFWKRLDEAMLKLCTKLLVLKLDGWHESVGVRAEIAFAAQHGIQIVFMEHDDGC